MEPPGSEKMATAGMILAMFFRCLLISFLSSLVHFSFVFRVFIRRCINPFIERTSMRMASLFTRISLLRYFLIIGLFSYRLPFPYLGILTERSFVRLIFHAPFSRDIR